MSAEEEPKQQQQEPEVPEDAIEVAQVPYAWLWSTWWLLAIVGILYFTGVFGSIGDPFVTPTVLVIIILVPRYWQWRRTRYYLTEDTLIYQRGGIMQTRRYQIPIKRLKDARARFGMFGRSLGFQHVDIMLDNGAVASLLYVPIQADIASYFRERMDSSPPDDSDEPDRGSEPDGGG